MPLSQNRMASIDAIAILDRNERRMWIHCRLFRAWETGVSPTIGLLGDHNDSVTAHRAIPVALEVAAQNCDCDIDYRWIESDAVAVRGLDDLSGLWCIPASPYRDMSAVLDAIRFGREQNLPFLGTCGGYQHAALEFVRNVLGHSAADNAEVNPAAEMPLIAGLACRLVEVTDGIRLLPGSGAARIYGRESIREDYHCSFGVNREYLPLFDDSAMRFTGFDEDGDPRVLEIESHAFFIGTAFQPERAALADRSHPLIEAFLRAVSAA